MRRNFLHEHDVIVFCSLINLSLEWERNFFMNATSLSLFSCFVLSEPFSRTNSSHRPCVFFFFLVYLLNQKEPFSRIRGHGHRFSVLFFFLIYEKEERWEGRLFYKHDVAVVVFFCLASFCLFSLLFSLSLRWEGTFSTNMTSFLVHLFSLSLGWEGTFFLN